jgi:outer membrane protein TolC
MVDLFAKLREEQVTFAKTAWAPNIAFLGAYVDISGNHNTILGAIDGLVAGLVVDWPIYDPARRAALREALGMAKAAEAFQKEIEQLITLEIETTGVECQRALITTFQAARALEIAQDYYDCTRQAFAHDLVSAPDVAVALGVLTFAKVQNLAAVFSYHEDQAKLRRVTAARELALGY